MTRTRSAAGCATADLPFMRPPKSNRRPSQTRPGFSLMPQQQTKGLGSSPSTKNKGEKDSTDGRMPGAAAAAAAAATVTASSSSSSSSRKQQQAAGSSSKQQQHQRHSNNRTCLRGPVERAVLSPLSRLPAADTVSHRVGGWKRPGTHLLLRVVGGEWAAQSASHMVIQSVMLASQRGRKKQQQRY